MKKIVAVMVLGFSILASAQNSSQNSSLMNCESSQVSINVSGQMIFDQSAYGWTNFRGRAIYKLKESGKTGTLPVYIMWKNDRSEEQRVIYVNMIEGEIAQAKKQADADHGYMGFAGLISRANLKGQYEAKWQAHRTPVVLKELNLQTHNMNCETK